MRSTPYDELKLLVDSANRNELECRKYLVHARGLLIDQTSHECLHETTEYRGHTGNSDYLIACRVTDGTGGHAIKAYLWEVKAPQCYIFEGDTQNRVCPTSDFISAENQLLHYYEESRGSAQFREEFNIVSPDDVMLGGIIIGSARTRVRSSARYDERSLQQLFQRALTLRRRHLYGESGIKILSWDRIVDYLQAQTAPPRQNETPVTAISIPLPANTSIGSSDQ